MESTQEPKQVQSTALGEASETGNATTQPHTMRAVVQSVYGPPADVLDVREIERPTVEDNEVLVQVNSAGIHIGDWLTISGLPYLIRLMGYGLTKPKNSIPGTEFAGRVAAVGADVADFKPGDEVFGWGSGAFGEYISISQDTVVLKPSKASFAQAAAVPISGFTALQAVRDHGNVKLGDKVLVIGASGGVGTYAVQIAKAMGAEVTGVVSARNLDMVRSIGADHVVDYTVDDFTRNGVRYDVIIDTAGNGSLAELRHTLTKHGILVIVGGSGGRFLMGAGRSLRATLLSPFVSQTLRAFISTTTKPDLEALGDLIDAGKVTPVIDRTYALDEAAEAVAHVGERHTRGKTVVTV